jgi:hypothetical protein
VIHENDDNTKTLGLPNLRYTTESSQHRKTDALNWLYQNAENIPFNQTILCSTNERVGHWNAIDQERSVNHPHELLSNYIRSAKQDDIYGASNIILPCPDS